MRETNNKGTGRHLKAPETTRPAAEAPRRRREDLPRRSPVQAAEPAPEYISRRDRRLAAEPEPERRSRRDRRLESEPAPRKAGTRSKGKKTKWFRTGLLIYALILIVGSILLQGTLWRYLKNSQEEMDRLAAEDEALHAHDNEVAQAPQRAFEAWMDGLSVDYWMDFLSARTDTGLDGQERLRNYLTEHFASDAVAAYKAAEYTKDAPVYVLKNGEETLARIAVTGAELDWSVSEISLPLLEDTYTVNITVPNSCTVTCNGVEVSRESLQPAESLLEYEPLEGELVNRVTWSTYTQEGFLLEPEINVQPPENYGLFQTEDDDYLLTVGIDVSQYEEKAVKFVRDYLNYVMNNNNATLTNMGIVQSHLNADTRAYQTIQNSYNAINWATYYQNIDTSQTEAVAVIFWAENCFSVDVAYDANATLSGKPVDYADATMRIFYLKTDNGFIISDFTTL